MNIFNLVFEVVLSVGPFLIFSKMGDGKDSGKLLFKSLKSSDSSVSFTEDESGLTFSSIGGGGPVPGIEKDEIAWGTGTGITSSTLIAYGSQIRSRALKVDKRSGYESIIGVSIWAGSSQCYNYVSSSRYCNNMIIAGRCNYIKGFSNNENNIILSGCCNYIYGRNFNLNNDYGCQNVILAGVCNKIDQSQNTVIVGGTKNEFSKWGLNSVIISSNEICLPEPSINSSFISSANFTFSSFNSISNGFENSSIISSNNVSNFNGLFGAFGFSQFDQEVSEQQVIASSDVGVNSCLNTIISSKSSYIFGTFSGKHSSSRNVIIGSCGAITWGSSGNLILASKCSGVGNRLDITTSVTVSNNLLISTYKSCICVASGNCCYLRNSAIIGGVCNKITNINFGFYCSVSGSVIINGCLNSIDNSDYSSIVSSIRGTVSRSYVSVMVGSDDSIIKGDLFPTTFRPKSLGNVLMTSCQSVINCSYSSAILSSITSTVSTALNSAVISSCGSYICSNGFAGGAFCGQNANMIVSSANSKIKTQASSLDDSNTIMAGIGNVIRNDFSPQGSIGIIAGSYNCIVNTDKSFIVAGEKNCIDSENFFGCSGILGGSNNRIKGKPIHSVIVGGEFNLIDTDITGRAISIVGGCNICNKFSYTTMVPQMRVMVFGNIWMCGFTGSTGTWSSTGAAIRVCNGLIVCIT